MTVLWIWSAWILNVALFIVIARQHGKIKWLESKRRKRRNVVKMPRQEGAE